MGMKYERGLVSLKRQCTLGIGKCDYQKETLSVVVMVQIDDQNEESSKKVKTSLIDVGNIWFHLVSVSPPNRNARVHQGTHE